jgi:hypothetical protein
MFTITLGFAPTVTERQKKMAALSSRISMILL